MSTSGTSNYTVNRDQLIRSAFRTLGVFNDDMPPPSTDMANAAEALNLMIKQWMSEGFLLWCMDEIVITLNANQILYTIGPGANVGTYKPLRVVEARYNHNGIDVPLNELSRQEYNRLANKNNVGTPNSFYYDPQTRIGNLYLYLASSSATGSVALTVQRPLQDMASSSDEFDFPVETLNALKNNLAAELINEYDVPEMKARRVEGIAARLKDAMFDFSEENASTFFTPRFQ